MAAVLVDYAPLVILVVLAFAMIWATLALTRIIGPSRRIAGKLSTYESGEVPQGSARGPMDIQYYIYVLVFLIIDIEAIFLIPWALNLEHVGLLGIVEMAVFIGFLLLGWAYAWKKGALAWQA